MVLGWLWPLLVLIVIVAVALAMRDSGRGDDDSGAAEEALARRYAEGEIDADEYRARSATLTAVRPRQTRQSSWLPLALAIGAIVLLIAALLWGGMGSGRMWDTMGRHMGWTQTSRTTDNAAQPYPDAPTVEVTANDLSFDPAEITLDAGEPVNLQFTNRGQVFHDLTIPDLDITLDAEPGATVTAGIQVDQPGTYEYLCTVPGHADAGMGGTLTVS